MCFYILLSLFITIKVNSAQAYEPMVYYKGEQVLFDTLPEIVNDRTFVPMRKIFEIFEADIQWDASTQTVVATRGSVSITVIIGKLTKVDNFVKTFFCPYIRWRLPPFISPCEPAGSCKFLCKLLLLFMGVLPYYNWKLI